MNAQPRVRVLPGDGVVTRSGPVVAVLLGDTTAPMPSLVAMLERLGGTGDELDPQVFSRELVARFAQSGGEPLPEVGAVALVGAELAVVLHGGVECRVTRPDGEVTLRGREASISVNVVLEGPFLRVALYSEGSHPGEGEPLSHLGAGVVPGSAAVVILEPVEAPIEEPDQESDEAPARAGPPSVIEEPDTTELVQPQPVDVPPAVEEAAVTAHAGQRAPLPTSDEEVAHQGMVQSDTGTPAELVDGIECSEGHFNHPYALECSVCGRSLLDNLRRTVQGPRQPLGTLTFEDGTAYVLDRNYVVGREPEQDPAVQAEQAKPLRLEDPDHLVSRVHADLRLVGWEVQVVDRGSANGTYVLAPEGSEWHRVPSDEPQAISPGTRVSIGRKVMTYDW